MAAMHLHRPLKQATTLIFRELHQMLADLQDRSGFSMSGLAIWRLLTTRGNRPAEARLSGLINDRPNVGPVRVPLFVLSARHELLGLAHLSVPFDLVLWQLLGSISAAGIDDSQQMAGKHQHLPSFRRVIDLYRAMADRVLVGTN